MANTLVALAVKKQDLSLYRRMERRLDERLVAIEGLEQQLTGLRMRRAALNARPPAVQLKSQHLCTLFLVAEPAADYSEFLGSGVDEVGSAVGQIQLHIQRIKLSGG